MRNSAFLFLLLLAFSCKNEDKPHDDQGGNNNIPPPQSISFSLVNTFPHDTSSYTQGLVMHNGKLYEGTGLEGRSRLMEVDLATGKQIRKIDLAPTYFGEGITIINDSIYQLTWQNKVVFLYSLKDFKKLNEFPLDTDGWGITTDGRELIVSDGTSNLSFYEPGTFRKLRTVSITESGTLVNNVNELEYIDGAVYANRYQTYQVLRIDPATGIVTGKIDFSSIAAPLKEKYPFIDVLNGIAWDSLSRKAYITGKWWPVLYEVQFGQ